METTYTWELKSLRKMNSGSYEDIVFGTTWSVTGTDEDGNVGTFTGATPFKADEVNPDEYIPFNELNSEIVLGWVKNSVSSSLTTSYWSHIEGQIKKQIDNTKFNVTSVESSNFPWIVTGSAEPAP